MLKNRIIYALFYMVVVVFYFFFDDYISLVLLVIATLIPLATVFIALHASKRIQLKISTDKLLAHRNDDIRFSLTGVNYSRFPIPFVRVLFFCRSFYEADEKSEVLMLSLPSRGTTQVNIDVRCARCCVAQFRTINYTVTDYFGLFSFSKKAELAVETTVMPNCVPLNISLDFREIYSAESEIFSKKKPGDDCSEVFQVREYRDGDSIRQIHHKLSDKLDRLMVKDFSMPVRSAVTVIAEYSIEEGDYDPEGVDTMLDILYSLSDRLRENSVSFTLVWFDGLQQRLSSCVIRDKNDVFTFFRALMHQKPSVGMARTVAEYNISGIPEANEHIFYVTPMLDIDEISKLINAPEPEKVTVLYTGNREAEIPGIARITPETVSDVCKFLA